MITPAMRRVAGAGILIGIALVCGEVPRGQAPASPARPPVHAREAKRLLIRNAMVIPGTGVPASGPARHPRRGRHDRADWQRRRARSGPRPTRSSTRTGKYVMPGIVNTHMHWHEERVGPIPIQYERNLYLASGVTTAREVGGDFEKTKQWRAESAAHTIVAPRIVLYPMLRDLAAAGPAVQRTPAEFRALVRAAKERGADGIKLIGPMDRDQAAAAHRRGEEGRTADHRAHRGRRSHGARFRRRRRQLHRALLRHRRRGARRHPGFPARDEPGQRDSPLRPRRRAVHAGRISITRSSRSCSTTWSRRESRGARRCRPTRRPATWSARRISPGTRTTCTRRSRTTTSRA